MSDEGQTFEQLWQSAIEGHVANLSAPALDALVEKVRGQAPPAPTREQAMRRTMAEKTAQLQGVARDHNGSVGSMAAAIDATGGPTPLAQPATPEPQASQGFSTNRAQQQSAGSDWAPVSERDVNKGKISDLLNRRP